MDKDNQNTSGKTGLCRQMTVARESTGVEPPTKKAKTPPTSPTARPVASGSPASEGEPPSHAAEQLAAEVEREVTTEAIAEMAIDAPPLVLGITEAQIMATGDTLLDDIAAYLDAKIECVVWKQYQQALEAGDSVLDVAPPEPSIDAAKLTTFISTANPLYCIAEPILDIYSGDMCKVVGEGRTGTGTDERMTIVRSMAQVVLASCAFLYNEKGNVDRCNSFVTALAENQHVFQSLCGVKIPPQPLTTEQAVNLGRRYVRGTADGENTDAVRAAKWLTLAIHDVAKLKSVIARAEKAAGRALTDAEITAGAIEELVQQGHAALQQAQEMHAGHADAEQQRRELFASQKYPVYFLDPDLLAGMQLGFASGFELAQFVQGEAPLSAIQGVGGVPLWFFDHYIADTAGIYPNAMPTDGASALGPAWYSSFVLNGELQCLFTDAIDIVTGPDTDDDKMGAWRKYRIGDDVSIDSLLDTWILASELPAEPATVRTWVTALAGCVISMARVGPRGAAQASARRRVVEALKPCVDLIARLFPEAPTTKKIDRVLLEYSPNIVNYAATAKEYDAAELTATLSLLLLVMHTTDTEGDGCVTVHLNSLKETLVASNGEDEVSSTRAAWNAAYKEVHAYTVAEHDATPTQDADDLLFNVKPLILEALRLQNEADHAARCREKISDFVLGLNEQGLQIPLAFDEATISPRAVTFKDTDGDEKPAVEYQVVSDADGAVVDGAEVSAWVNSAGRTRQAAAECMAIACCVLKGVPAACEWFHHTVTVFNVRMLHDSRATDWDDVLVIKMYQHVYRIAQEQGWHIGDKAQVFYDSATRAMLEVDNAIRNGGRCVYQEVTNTDGEEVDMTLLASRPFEYPAKKSRHTCLQGQNGLTKGKPSSNMRAYDGATAEEHQATADSIRDLIMGSANAMFADFPRPDREGRLVFPTEGSTDGLYFQVLPEIKEGMTEDDVAAARALQEISAEAFAKAVTAFGDTCEPTPEAMAAYVLGAIEPHLETKHGVDYRDDLYKCTGKYHATYLADVRSVVAALIYTCMWQ